MLGGWLRNEGSRLTRPPHSAFGLLRPPQASQMTAAMMRLGYTSVWLPDCHRCWSCGTSGLLQGIGEEERMESDTSTGSD